MQTWLKLNASAEFKLKMKVDLIWIKVEVVWKFLWNLGFGREK